MRFIFFFCWLGKQMCHRYEIKTLRWLRLLANNIVWCCHLLGSKMAAGREIDRTRLHLNFKLAFGWINYKCRCPAFPKELMHSMVGMMNRVKCNKLGVPEFEYGSSSFFILSIVFQIQSIMTEYDKRRKIFWIILHYIKRKIMFTEKILQSWKNCLKLFCSIFK